MFGDLSFVKLAVIAVIAVALFGPDKLPEFIQKTADLLRKVRAASDSAKQEIRSELGPQFKDFEFEDLHPKTFVRKHLLEGDALPLEEIRNALDPRAELAAVVEAVRRPADATAAPEAPAPRVNLTKDAQGTPPSHPPVDIDAT
ncbi:sec-independent translocase [Streptomyces yunnanensis]|uniref:Sec-independent protein translocase protein TatB n=1 Tax=Streptomyces yunnanensis TaxID=156453 RepID=A0A9X8QX19_9ACTN|nr:sec-independent translocase [Streptomyces yunnanensis]SHM77096.1 sec-independent protein translocase protein TatB [Streptomyces yunnanensis]